MARAVDAQRERFLCSEPELGNLGVAVTLERRGFAIAGRLFAQLTELDPAEGTIACRVSGRSCDCDLSAILGLTGSGTYSTANGQVISGSSSAAYCVSGDQLRYEAALGGVATAVRR